MEAKDIRTIALFFFFAFSDDRMAVPAAIQAVNLARQMKKKNPDRPNDDIVIRATARVWDRLKPRTPETLLRLGNSPGWNLPPKTDLTPWREFQKSASSEELTVVIWSTILHFDHGAIARALELGEGTVSYRLGHALKKLGGSAHQRPRLL